MRNKKIFSLFTLLSLSYLLIVLITPTDESVLTRYGLSSTQVSFLELTVSLPVVFIWYLAYYGWSKISSYANTIKDTKEGPAFRKISNGLLALVLWMPLSTSMGTFIRNIFDDNPGLTAPLVISNNYINLTVLIVATVFISKGAFELKSLAAKYKHKWSLTKVGWVILVILSFMYVYLTMSNPYRLAAGDNGTATYYLPDWLLASTIVFPSLIVFYLGFRAVQYMHIYKHSVSGIIYKSALGYIANGVAVSIVAILGIRYLASINSLLEEFTLRIVLLAIYLLLLVIASGFWLIAKGAKQLQKLEEL